MTEKSEKSDQRAQVNLIGLTKSDYRGNPSTLCQGCGHNSISSQIIAACYEMDIVPENIVKFSGIGCSSKSPTYFLNRPPGVYRRKQWGLWSDKRPVLCNGRSWAPAERSGLESLYAHRYRLGSSGR